MQRLTHIRLALFLTMETQIRCRMMLALQFAYQNLEKNTTTIPKIGNHPDDKATPYCLNRLLLL